MSFNKAIIGIILSVLALSGFWLLGPLLGRLAGTNHSIVAAVEVALTVAWVISVVALIRSISSIQFSLSAVALLTLAFGGLVILAVKAQTLQPLPSILVVISASLLGCLVSRIFREPNILLPISLLAPLIDYWTISHGPVGTVIRFSPDMLEKVSAAIPGAVPLRPSAFIGAGDFMFMALFLAAAERLKMSPGRTAVYFAILVSVAMTVVLFGPAWVPMPGLVAIGLGFIAANMRHFRLNRTEIAITCALALCACVLVVYIGLKGDH